MKKIILTLIISFFTAALSAQDIDSFFYNPQADEDLKITETSKSFSTKGIQYGAQISPVFISDTSGDDKLNSYIVNFRVWAKSYLWKNSFVYARVKNSYLGVITADGTYDSVESDNVADLDLGYLSASNSSGSLNFSTGRKYYSLGTGVALNGRGDGAEISWYAGAVDIKILGLYTGLMMKDNNPYGLSDADTADGAKRIFSGGILTLSFLNQQAYLFGMAQFDLSDEDSDNKSRYDSQYYGIGLNGKFLTDAAYYAEFIYQTGTSYISTSNEESDIKAYAVNSGVNYFVPAKLSPVLMLQYAYGSGDADRGSYTSSNRPGGSTGDDSGFIHFGTYNGGYALKPKLSNIHIFRGGFSFTPARRMSLITKYSYYIKDQKESPINGGSDATLANAWIGQEIDLSFRWRIFYDLSFYVNYGLFLPGDAYASDAENENFVMSGLNLNF